MCIHDFDPAFIHDTCSCAAASPSLKYAAQDMAVIMVEQEQKNPPSPSSSSISIEYRTHLSTINNTNGDEEEHSTPQQPTLEDNERLLNNLASQLDLWMAGSLFLLPSIFPYLASALSFYADTNAASSASTTVATTSSAFPFSSSSSYSNHKAIPETQLGRYGYNWGQNWILLLPCIGIMLPLSAFKIMSLIEERKKCKMMATRNRSNDNSDRRKSGTTRPQKCLECGLSCPCHQTASTTVPNAISGAAAAATPAATTIFRSQRSRWAMSCLAVSAVKRTFTRLKGSHPSGYGPLTLDSSSKSPTSPSWSVFVDANASTTSITDLDQDQDQRHSALRCACCCDNSYNTKRRSRFRFSSLPRPRSILLTSLGLWTILMALSSTLGFNTIIPSNSSSTSLSISAHLPSENSPTYPRRAKYDLSQDPYSTEDSQEIDLRVWEPQQPRLIHQDGFIMADDVEDENDDDLDVGHGPLMETLAAMIDLERAQEDPQTIEAVTEPAAPEARGQKPLSQMVWLIDTNDSAENLEGALHKYDLRHPDAKILPDAVILDKQKYLAAVMSFEDVDDQDVEDFLNSDSLEALTIDARDASAFRDFLATLEAEGTSEDQLEDQRHQQHQQWVKATNDLVIDPILEHDLPVVGWTPTVIRGFPQMFQKILNSATESSKRLFSQAARSVPYSQNLGHDVRRARGQIFEYVAGWTECMILVVAMCLGGLLVGLVQGKILYHQILIQNESQQQLLFERDVKEVPKYCRRRATWSTRLSCFALSGSALALTLLMIISECWDVPSANFVGIGLAGMILVHSGIPDMALEVDFQQAEDEDKLEDVRHEVEHDEKKDWTPVVMTERRNACSLDESHRWEVSSRCLETSCFRC